jgi:uncharacterized protein (DUF2141 family)
MKTKGIIIMNIRTKLLSLIVFALMFAQNSRAENAGLKVIITHIDNTKGNVVLAIYNQDDNFPYNPFKKYTIDKESMIDGKLEYVIPDINPGEYLDYQKKVLVFQITSNPHWPVPRHLRHVHLSLKIVWLI